MFKKSILLLKKKPTLGPENFCLIETGIKLYEQFVGRYETVTFEFELDKTVSVLANV